MGLVKRSQLLKVVEGIPGNQTEPSWSGAHAVDVIDLAFTQSRALNPRQTAKASLSKTIEAIGRGQVGLTFAVDVKGSGSALSLPNYDDFLVACLMNQGGAETLQLNAPASLGIGDLITGDSSGATAIVLETKTSATTYAVAVRSGTFSTSEDLNSEYLGDAAAVAHASAPLPGTALGFFWNPWSQPALTFDTTGAWSASPPAVGETFAAVTALGEVLGGGTIIAIDGSETTCEWNWGTLAAGASLISTSAKTATVASPTGVTQTEGKSLTLRPNRAGLARPMYGTKGTFSIRGEAGGQARFNFSFTGKAGTPTDAQLATGATFPTTVPPRLIGGRIVVNGVPIPTKSFELDINNTVVMSADANATEGDKRADITDRNPQLTLELDQIGVTAFQWWNKWGNGTPVRVGIQLGSTPGNIIGISAGNAQISEIADGDVDGIATHSVTMMLREESTNGNDEIFIAHL